MSERPHLLKQRNVYESGQKTLAMEIIRFSTPYKKKIFSFIQYLSDLIFSRLCTDLAATCKAVSPFLSVASTRDQL